MTKFVAVILLACAGLALSACAHQDLTAPCSAASDWWSGAAYAATHNCGPMRSIN
jgi:hypothetical protein